MRIAREPTFVLDEELGNTCGDILVRTRSDSEVSTLKKGKAADVRDSINVVQQKTPFKCKIVGTLMKDGENTSSKERIKSENVAVTRKFQVVRVQAINLTSSAKGV